MLARASVISYEIKVEYKGILERVSATRSVTSLAKYAMQWSFSHNWATVRQLLRGADFYRPGRISEPSIPFEVAIFRAQDIMRH